VFHLDGQGRAAQFFINILVISNSVALINAFLPCLPLNLPLCIEKLDARKQQQILKGII